MRAVCTAPFRWRCHQKTQLPVPPHTPLSLCLATRCLQVCFHPNQPLTIPAVICLFFVPPCAAVFIAMSALKMASCKQGTSTSLHLSIAGAKHGQQQFRVQLQSVDLSVKDLELMCKSSDTAEQPDRARQSDEMTQSGMHVCTLHLSSV